MAENKFLMYKNYPIVRNGKTIYYGNSYDKYIIMMQIATTKKVGDTEIADKILVQLLNTDPMLRPKDRIAKKADKKGMAEAMELAAIWLQRSNAAPKAN